MSKIFLILFWARLISCENILFVSLLPAPSHHSWNEVLIEGLLSKNHNVTLIGYFPPSVQSSKYNVLKVDVAPSFAISIDSILGNLAAEDNSASKTILDMATLVKTCCEHSLNSPELRELMKYPRDLFDLLILDITFSECYLPLIDHFGGPPVVTVTPFGMHSYMNDLMGQRTENYIPYYSFPYTDRMGFFERFRNAFFVTLERASRWYLLIELNEMCKKVFGRDVRSIEELLQDISLMFANDHPILDYPKPSAPNVIPIGGVQVRAPKELDQDLQRIMDESTDGVIFASLGSNFLPRYYGDHAIEAFVEAFSRLNLTVLWKFDDLEVPKNVVVRKWFSQRDVLAHPNTKLFITHCGGLSKQETIIRGVPVVGIPLFADQSNQAGKIVSIGGGVILKYWELTADNVYNSIMEVLSNPKYKQNMLRLSTLYKEQPEKPMEKFLVWIDYVLKHGHLDHLSIGSRRMTWYQMDNWDLLGFTVILFIISFIFLKWVCRCIREMCNDNKERKKIE